MSKDMIDAVLSLVPSAEVVVRGTDLSAEIEWINPSEPPVTMEQIVAEYERLQTAITVPSEVTAWQAKKALLGVGLYTQVETAINSMEGDAGISARIDWQTAATFKRNWPLIEGVRQSLGKSKEDIDTLFILAASL